MISLILANVLVLKALCIRNYGEIQIYRNSWDLWRSFIKDVTFVGNDQHHVNVGIRSISLCCIKTSFYYDCPCMDVGHGHAFGKNDFVN